MEMALYFMSYDLRQERDYKKLYDELNHFGAVRIIESTWCFDRLNTTAAAMRNHFRELVDLGDGLVVLEVGGWATRGTVGSPYDLA